ncbi:hypothetical protein [Cellulomonas sp.]|uniref:hypothetical protein n=1 Tax=Cellulomonas sp. TaxID=40001 RepID=UPI003BAC884A
MSPLRLGELHDLLTSDIRVHLDREQVLALDPEVTLSAGQAGRLAASVVPPWFFDGRECVDFDVPGSVSHTFEWVARHSSIDASVDRVPPGPLAVPCYRIDERILCLDGNHRLLALVRRRPQAVVVTLTIEGPTDPRLLPDLVHFAAA